MLTCEGLPLREIAMLTGASPATIMRDQRESGVSNETQASPRQQAARDREAGRHSPLGATKAGQKKAAKTLRTLGTVAKPTYAHLEARVKELEAELAQARELITKLEAERRLPAEASQALCLPRAVPRGRRICFVILGQGGQTGSVPRRDQSLLAEIERGALDHAPLTGVLQKCIALGGQTRNAELRDWASQELHGYRNDNEIPEYRIIHVPLMVNGVTPTHQITGQQISAWDLPAVAHESISEELKLAHGVGDLQGLVRNAERSGKTAVMMVPNGSADLVKLMNHEMQGSGQTIMSLYWNVNTARIEGTLEQIRTTLIRLVSEMRATMSDDASMPSAEQAAQALNVVLHGGKRNQVTVNAPQAASGGTASIQPAGEYKESGWTKNQTIWTVISVIVALVGLYIAYRQWRG